SCGGGTCGCCGAAVLARLRRLEKDHFRFFVRRGAMLDTVGHDEKFAFVQLDHPIAKFDPHPAAPNQKKLIFTLMLMPGKNTLEFHHLHLLTVQFADDLWAPMFGKSSKFL